MHYAVRLRPRVRVVRLTGSTSSSLRELSALADDSCYQQADHMVNPYLLNPDSLSLDLWPGSTLLGRLVSLSVTAVGRLPLAFGGGGLLARHLLEFGNDRAGAATNGDEGDCCGAAIGLKVSRERCGLRPDSPVPGRRAARS